MSLTPIGEPRRKISVASLRENKQHHQPITCLTAYDYASARLVDEAGIDIVLVGDSLAMTMLGSIVFAAPSSNSAVTRSRSTCPAGPSGSKPIRPGWRRSCRTC